MGRNPGKFDRRISFQTRTVTRGASGGAGESYVLLDTVWAQKIEEGTREFRAAAATHSEATRAFRIRYRSDVTPQHRVVYGGQFHDILGVTEEGRSEYLLLACAYTEGRAA